LDWSQRDVAARAQVSSSTVRNFEAGRRNLHGNNLRAIQRVFEEEGFRFQYTPEGHPLGITRP
jgi:transcriptional regulator with XRE-family HTH domain